MHVSLIFEERGTDLSQFFNERIFGTSRSYNINGH